MEKFNSTGTFFGIGVGPGDPELLTVKAIKAIKMADVIIAPKTEKKDDSLALSIAKPYLKDNVEIVHQTFPMVSQFETFSKIFEDNEREILNFLQAGKNVAFLTIGDPLFYSTYIYIFRLLKDSNINIEIIPGITAFLAISSYIQKPVACGDDILTVIPATADYEKIAKALKISDTTVIMKVYKNFNRIVDMLKCENMADEAVLVSRYGLEDEKIIKDVENCKIEKLNYLSTILTKRK